MNCTVIFNGRVSNQTTDFPINWGHDVLLDTAHDLLDSIVEKVSNIIGNLMDHTLRSV